MRNLQVFLSKYKIIYVLILSLNSVNNLSGKINLLFKSIISFLKCPIEQQTFWHNEFYLLLHEKLCSLKFYS